MATTNDNFVMGWLTLYILSAIIILSTEVWYLRQKHCSYFNLFYNLLWVFGLFCLLTLSKKAGKGYNQGTKDDGILK